ncbi:glutamate--cysteine ligase, chloroplastic-like [Vigna umbellata]|uniref:glutamate--cysteine ligase, chloroplastic-like n=1 Tax=Vigna umbellata TaxID=87088 RepID=UPI001F5F37CA|nr:glutamate--cysteine ligase, chloroplastic-like [Vigna umbellata]
MAVVSRTTTTYSYSHLSRRHFDRETKASAANTLSCSAWVSAKKPSPTQRIATRGGRVIVAASPPTEDAVVVTDPLTKQDLVDYLASGCKPRENWRIGTEHEKFGFEFGSLRPMKYEQIAELLNGIAERFDWDKIMEGDKIIGLKQGKQSISLEPGGQFELSGAPLETLHQTCAEVNSHLYQVGHMFL